MALIARGYGRARFDIKHAYFSGCCVSAWAFSEGLLPLEKMYSIRTASESGSLDAAVKIALEATLEVFRGSAAGGSEPVFQWTR